MYTREVREGFGVGLWKEIRKEGSFLQNKVVFLWGMTEMSSFGKIIGVGTLLFVTLFRLCMHLRLIKRLD